MIHPIYTYIYPMERNDSTHIANVENLFYY